MTFFARSSEWTRAHKDVAEATPVAGQAHHYFAFLSYSHKDSASAGWLHEALEKYRVPRALVGKQTAAGIVPPRLSPIFRDRSELPASGDLGHTIREALACSRCLIVLCSPDAAHSRWTNEEIVAFKKAHPEGRVLAAIVEGEPFASDTDGREAEECFPPALRQKFDSRGRPTARRSEPIAADLREAADGRQLGLLKIVAGMIGVGLDDLVQREQHRRQRRLTFIAAASVAGMIMTSGLAAFAFDKRDEARDQRREAEGLVGFMLGDLREKLEPIGRLDALDAVGSRALAYYQGQDKADLPDESLAQRSKALTLMGEIANSRGDLDRALQLYREAFASTREAVRREPDDPQRLFDHAQNVFWVGEIAHQRGNMRDAEASMREYKRLADAMVALEPDNSKWRLEVKYATTALGALLYEQRRFKDASAVLQRALETAEGLAAAEPANVEYQKSLVETLAWLADSQFGEGRLDEAIAKRERQVAILDALIAKHPADTGIRERAISANRALGRWLGSRGALREGLEHQRKAVLVADALLPTEPSNMDWLQWAAGAQLDYAASLLEAKRVDDAAAQTRAGCDRADRLTDRTAGEVAEWRALAVDCLMRRSQVALAEGAKGEALAFAQRSLAQAQSRRAGQSIDRRTQIAESQKLIGDIEASSGDREAAEVAWQSALTLMPKDEVDPRNLAIRAELLAKIGRRPEAQQLKARLQSMGYRRIL